MSVLRPLPARPSLEYARKEAKGLLRRLRAGDPEALARTREYHSSLEPTNARLADAQLVVAREHGFASWPKLVRYMGDVERQQLAHVQLHGDRSQFDAFAQQLITQHRARGLLAGRAFAAYVPRFYGLSLDEVFSRDVSEDEARLAVARTYGAPSWAILLERAERDDRGRTSPWEIDPMRRVAEAMASGNVDALERIVEAHPELLHPSEYDITAGRTLMWMAVGQERDRGMDAIQPVMMWLADHGVDRQRELDLRLRGHIGMSVEEVKDLLDRGANPNATAANGIPMLEHALLRYWNGEAVDVLAARTNAHDAFWIAAGLGDVDAVSRFLDRSGRPTNVARRTRPDFIAVGSRGFMPQLPDADDEEVLVEAMLVAMLNGRTRVIEYLASRGVPVDSMVYGAPLVTLAAANGMVAAVDSFVRSGADIDLRGWSPKQTAREIARELFLNRPDNADRRRIIEIFRMDPDTLLAERDATAPTPPVIVPNLHRALLLATVDAKQLGQSEVSPENLLFGLLRTERQALGFVKNVGRMDVDRFRTDFTDRLSIDEQAPNTKSLPLDPEAQASLDAATAHAMSRRSEAIGELELLQALLRDDSGAARALLARYGVDVQEFRSAVERNLRSTGPARVYRKKRKS